MFHTIKFIKRKQENKNQNFKKHFLLTAEDIDIFKMEIVSKLRKTN